MSENKSIVFMVAGTSGSGKSTMLRRAYHHNIPIFGEERNAMFQATNPLREREMQPFNSALPAKLFQGKHVPELIAYPERPEFFVVHLDLLNLLMFLVTEPAISDRMPAHLRHEGLRPVEDLLDQKKNSEIFTHYLKIAFPYAEPLLVNTLYLSFHRNAQQWNERAEFLRRTSPGVDVDSFQFMYNEKYPRPDIHRIVHESWFDALRAVPCERAFVSKGVKGKLEMQELIPKSGITREYPFPPVKGKAGAD